MGQIRRVEVQPYVQIGERLRQRREITGFSRRKLVEMLRQEGICTSVSSLQDLELGRRFNLRITAGLAKFLGCHLEEFLGSNGEGEGLTLVGWQRLLDKSQHLDPGEKLILQAALEQIGCRRREGRQEAEN